MVSFFACEWGRASPFRGTPLTIAEADGNDAGTAKARFASACGSAKEVRAGLQLAVAYGYLPTSGVNGVDIALDEVCAMSWRLSAR